MFVYSQLSPFTFTIPLINEAILFADVMYFLFRICHIIKTTYTNPYKFLHAPLWRLLAEAALIWRANEASISC
jgi:hypothetical protein